MSRKTWRGPAGSARGGRDRAYETCGVPRGALRRTPYSLSLFDVRRLETCDGCAFGPMAR